MADKTEARIDVDKPRYDQQTFKGRLLHFLDITDVRMWMTSDSQIEQARHIIKRYKNGEKMPIDEVWRAKKIKDATTHPDTGESVFLPFRISGFVPINALVTAGMLIPNNPSLATAMFWQWVNQSYNVGMNYANRNASNPMSNQQIAEAYLLACGVSCGIAGGLGQVVKRLNNVQPATRLLVQKFVPFVAVATAGIANLFLMRANELKDGISVTDENGQVVGEGRSPKAGLRAIVQTAASRLVIPAITLTIPPVIMNSLEKTSWLSARPALAKGINFTIITAMMAVALPLAVAVFPQQSSVSVKKLEPKYHNLKDSNGNPIETVYYNKGL
eukprot:TRINITY_DN16367_c0_g1_i1.p1 TRINITY_DN16367_c0_g1~~TRINITY_DN16367_c0_g1_i1.p1  ORF type:complete len:337 (+),score=57.02 TRINITY_DN16367_c0_g1_i1:22-1011(+)